MRTRSLGRATLHGRTAKDLGNRRQRRPVLAILWLLIAVAAQAAETDQPPRAQGRITAELNRADTVETGCRLSFVIHNETPHDFGSMQWDLVSFDPEGLIAARMAAEIAPLKADKTSVKQFDILDFDCEHLARLLLNAVAQCSTNGAEGEVSARNDCLDAMELSTRTRIEFLK